MHRDEQAATAAASMARTVASHYRALRQAGVGWFARVLFTVRFVEMFYGIVLNDHCQPTETDEGLS